MAARLNEPGSSAISARPGFVVATPARTVCDDNARALHRQGALRFIALGTRSGTAEIPADKTRLNPMFGLFYYVVGRMFSAYRAESLCYRTLPLFDRWVRRQLTPGDHIISSYGYANECFRWVRSHGGKTFVDAGNSHPDQFWSILSEEHRRWKCPHPPVAPHWIERSRQMMAHVDYVLSPSSFVTNSFLERGFRREQILRNVYPVNLSCFEPARVPRPQDRPLTVISTGMLSLRKGAPYMLEAFRLVHRRHPSARFLLTRNIRDCCREIVQNYSDLPIDWAPGLPHAQLAERLRSADIFVLPSLEEGLVRTALEAMACGLPAILTPNTGANDFIVPDRSGEVVPIRDAPAVAEAILKWGDIVMNRPEPPRRLIDVEQISFARFESEFIGQLKGIGLI